MALGRQHDLLKRAVFFGPAFVAAIGYIDPGNYATNIQAGAQYGPMLLWVIVWANLIAVLVQLLSSKLGLAMGLSLAEVLREHLPPWATWAYWVQAEILAIATDLAEFVGAALGFELLFGVTLLQGAILTGIISWAILAIERRGMKALHLVIGTMLVLVAALYVLELALSHPAPTAIVKAAIVPMLSGKDSVYLAAGILGATVMPHAIYLHSALSRSDARTFATVSPRRLWWSSRWDVAIAMTLASFVNMAMLAMAAAVFHPAHSDIAGSRPPTGRWNHSWSIRRPRLRAVPHHRRARLDGGGDAGRAGGHAGLRGVPDPTVCSPCRHHGSVVPGRSRGLQRYPGARAEPGDLELRYRARPCPPCRPYEPGVDHGRTRERPGSSQPRLARGRHHRHAERGAAGDDLKLGIAALANERSDWKRREKCQPS
jgi:hypothetical protein